jgi:hypothetical protein
MMKWLFDEGLVSDDLRSRLDVSGREKVLEYADVRLVTF